MQMFQYVILTICFKCFCFQYSFLGPFSVCCSRYVGIKIVNRMCFSVSKVKVRYFFSQCSDASKRGRSVMADGSRLI